MALKSTIFKADVQIADMDRNYYAEHSLTLARHPSETDERLMARLLAFIFNADPALEFGKGISTDDEPDLWQKDLTGNVERWIDLGQPDERDIRRACGRANHVALYLYGGRSADVWWQQTGPKLAGLDNLSVWRLPQDSVAALAKLAERNMKLQATIQEGLAWLGNDQDNLSLEPVCLKGEKGREK